jgi:hypothetical protein
MRAEDAQQPRRAALVLADNKHGLQLPCGHPYEFNSLQRLLVFHTTGQPNC